MLETRWKWEEFTMRRQSVRRGLALVLALVMVLLMLPTGIWQAQAAEITYTLDATADLTAFAAGEKADGDNEDVGTEGYFTVFYSAKTKVDGSNKTFDDGYTASQRLNFGGKSDFGDVIKNAVKFTTAIRSNNNVIRKIFFNNISFVRSIKFKLSPFLHINHLITKFQILILSRLQKKY